MHDDSFENKNVRLWVMGPPFLAAEQDLQCFCIHILCMYVCACLCAQREQISLRERGCYASRVPGCNVFRMRFASD